MPRRVVVGGVPLFGWRTPYSSIISQTAVRLLFLGIGLFSVLLGPLVLGAPLNAPTDQTETVRVNIRRSSHTYQGFGANIWPGDLHVEKAVVDLGMMWVRLWAGCPPNPPKPDARWEEFQRWWRRHPGALALRQTARMLSRHRVKTVLCVGTPPSEWLGPGYVLKPDYYEAFARMWSAAVEAHREAGITPQYIELYNEPDGHWGIHVSPEVNAKLTQMVRAELEARGLRGLGICGPGTSHADWGDGGDPYIRAMDADTVKALAAWSNHAWEWNLNRIHGSEGHLYLREAWTSIMNAIRGKDPGRTRPILVTEFATKAHVFHGKEYADPGKGRSDYGASDTSAYAARVAVNAIQLLNGGANVLIVWEGADQSWSNHEWGLMTRPERGSTARPVYSALATLFRHLPVGARVLPAENKTDCAVAALVAADSIVLLAANGTACSRRLEVILHGVRNLKIVRSTAFGAAHAGIQKERLTLDLPSDSVMAVTLAHRNRRMDRN